MTQTEFAEAFHLPIATLRDWEQRRSTPAAPARALLLAIERGRREKLAELDRMLAEGLDELRAGKGIPAEQVFAEVRAEIRKSARKANR